MKYTKEQLLEMREDGYNDYQIADMTNIQRKDIEALIGQTDEIMKRSSEAEPALNPALPKGKRKPAIQQLAFQATEKKKPEDEPMKILREMIECSDMTPMEIGRRVFGRQYSKLMKRHIQSKYWMRLREAGFTNADIAKRAGVCLATINRYIGRQPKSITATSRRKATVKRKVNQVCRKAAADAYRKEQEEVAQLVPETEGGKLNG